MPARCRSGGFTLLELAVVLFILSLMAMIAFPALTFTGEGKAKSEGKRVASILRFLDDTARATKQNLPLAIDVSQRVFRYRDGGAERSEHFDSLLSLRIPSLGTLKEGEVTLEFGPLGAAESAEITFSRDGMPFLIVSYNPLSGRVRLSEVMDKNESR